ncbi:MAG: ParB/RepB/Spo0J family partition protein [Desulfobacterales bacterium]
MSPKNHTFKTLSLKNIVPSPFQQRTNFDPEKLKELARSITREGLIFPILVRPLGKGYELIAGERRFRAIRDYTTGMTIEARILEADDIAAQRLSATENIQREDLTVFETIEATVRLVDAELIDVPEYVSMGPDPVDRVKTLLSRLDAVRRSEQRGNRVADTAKLTSHRFVGHVEKLFKNLPKSLEWRSFYTHDLNLLVQAPQSVRDASVDHELNRSQTWALEKLNRVSEERFEALVNKSAPPRTQKDRRKGSSPGIRRLKDFSAAEIEAIAEKEIGRQNLAEQGRVRETIPLVSMVKAQLMHRLGIPMEIVASNLGINWRTAKRYCQDKKWLETIGKALAGGATVDAVAKKHAIPEPLVWSVALEGKDDRERFEALGWKIRTWDYWFWNNCDMRFGDDWPGRIPAQMIGHILYYFSDQGDQVLDPTTGGGVVPDTCLALNRRCRSFDMVDRLDIRPEIETHFWDENHMTWPIKGKDKPNLVIFDPPYFSKKSGDYDPKAISGMSRESYLDFMVQFLSLTHRHTEPTCRIALINADWRDFQRTPARDETRENAILIRDYLGILDRSGWEETHIIQAPLSSERFTGNMVNAMQKKRTLGVISRYVIVARKSG